MHVPPLLWANQTPQARCELHARTERKRLVAGSSGAGKPRKRADHGVGGGGQGGPMRNALVENCAAKASVFSLAPSTPGRGENSPPAVSNPFACNSFLRK